MPSIPTVPQLEREAPAAYIPRRWIIWDPIPDYLDLRPDMLIRIFRITLEIEKEHLAIEQRKLDMVMELFK